MGEVLENPNILTGLGATLSVNVDTRAFRYLLRDLGRQGIDPITPEDAHVTLIDSYETRFPVASERDQLALDRARDEAGRYLSSTRVDRLTLTPDSNQIVKFKYSKRKVGIILNEQEELQDIKDDLEDIFREEARIRLVGRRATMFHLRLGSRSKDYYKLRKDFTLKEREPLKIPRLIRVTGFDISERTYDMGTPEPSEDSELEPRRQNYRNLPKSVRRAG